MDQLFGIAVAGGVIAGILYAIRPKWSVVFVADGSGIRTCRGVPRLHEATISEFIQKQVPPRGRIRVRGQRQKNGLLRLQIDGDVDASARQRIRNFLLALL